MDNSIASLHAAEREDIKPYKIHVSSKYLDLTKKKLELTRLPHEVHLPRQRAWDDGTPKSEIEPLIDFWLEHYTWRERETQLNTTLPQFRISLSLSPPHTPSSPLRIHFLHIKSPHLHALPLLLLPTFPLTNLSLTPLFTPLTSPSSPASTQPFTLIVPSLPALGFSDAFSSQSTSASSISNSAALCDSLMKRLGYTYYLASATGSGKDSPAGIDYHLLRILGEEYKDSCLGIHVLEPCVRRPRLREQPVRWMEFALAKFFHANWFGYEKADFVALHTAKSRVRHCERSSNSKSRHSWAVRQDEENQLLARSRAPAYGAVALLGLREPNTFAYALCDSPVGLLSLVLSALRRKSPNYPLSPTEIIDVTQLAWLPGPEASARFWASALAEVEDFEEGSEGGGKKGGDVKTRVAVTVFNGDSETEEEYICPAWASSRHEVLFSQRASGRPGVAVWERVDVLLNGIRGLAREVEMIDPRLRFRGLDEVVGFEEPILEEEGDRDWGSVGERGRESVDHSVEESEERGMQLEVESPDTVVAVETRRDV